MGLRLCGLGLSRGWGCASRRLCSARSRRGGDHIIIGKQVNGGLLSRRLWGRCNSLRGRPFDLRFFLDNRKRHIIVPFTQGRWIRHATVHDPSLRFVLGSNEVLDFCIRRNVARREFGFPVLIGPSIAPFQHALYLFIRPGVQIDRLNPTYMCTHTTVDTRATNADKYTQIPRRPSRVFVALAVSAYFVGLEF